MLCLYKHHKEYNKEIGYCEKHPHEELKCGPMLCKVCIKCSPYYGKTCLICGQARWNCSC